jgi:hypothetical protein
MIDAVFVVASLCSMQPEQPLGCVWVNPIGTGREEWNSLTTTGRRDERRLGPGPVGSCGQ